MVKLVAMYKQPKDPAAFDRHYREVHLPLARKMPGVKRIELSRFTGTPVGSDAPFYFMAEIYFDNADAARAALGSPEGKAAGKDIMSVAGDIILMMNADVEEA
ncbi:MAG: EthD family reductase [Phycisphaerae bacterium]